VTQTAHRTLVAIGVALALLVPLAGCGSSPSTTAPSTTVTETFSGTVAVAGSDFHTFSASRAGDVSVTLTAAGPPATIPMGVGIGIPSGATCTLVPGASTITAAGTSAQLVGLISNGTLCVQVYDASHQTDAVTYAVTVVHP
jgi:hypothetical protein